MDEDDIATMMNNGNVLLQQEQPNQTAIINPPSILRNNRRSHAEADDMSASSGASQSSSTSRNNRARIDPTVKNPHEAEELKKTPICVTEEMLKNSVQSLHDEIAILLTFRGKEYIALASLLSEKNRRKDRLEKDTAYIPTST